MNVHKLQVATTKLSSTFSLIFTRIFNKNYKTLKVYLLIDDTRQIIKTCYDVTEAKFPVTNITLEAEVAIFS